VPHREHRADAFDDLLGDIVAAALRAEHLLQSALELGVPVTRGTLPEMPLDLHALQTDELAIEVELDLTEHVLAVSL
jgi:hypothetical protein